MNKKNLSILIYTVIFIVAITVISLIYNNLSQKYVPGQPGVINTDKKGNPAPGFIVYNEDGEEVNFSDYKGKPTVINFWATWCTPCKSELPYFENAYKKYGESINFMMVNLTDGSYETTHKVKSFIETEGYTFPVLFDNSSNAAAAYQTTAIPVTVFIDEKGKIIHKQIGVIQEQTLFNYIDSLIGE